MTILITGLYGGLLGLTMLFLAMQVSGKRMKQKSSIATDTTPALFEAIRRHGNFVEWVPFALILMAVCEINGLQSLYLHILGASLVVGRLIHPWGIKAGKMPHPLRAIGAGVTFAVVFSLCSIAIWQWFEN